jgi:methylase of polypeptide subunit release factors
LTENTNVTRTSGGVLVYLHQRPTPSAAGRDGVSDRLKAIVPDGFVVVECESEASARAAVDRAARTVAGSPATVLVASDVDAIRFAKENALPALFLGEPDELGAQMADAQARPGELTSDSLEAVWLDRPLPPTLDVASIRALGELIHRSGVAADTLMGGTEAEGVKGGLWQRFRTAVEAGAPSRDRGREALGPPLLDALIAADLVWPDSSGRLSARLRLLNIDGILQLKEAPQLTDAARPNCPPLSRLTCLEGDSVKAALAFEKGASHLRPSTFLEVGVGSGFVLSWLLRRFQDAAGTGTDIDARAARLTRLNVALNGREDRAHVLQGDMFAALPAAARFDLAVFHPPYRIVTPDRSSYPGALFRAGTAPDGLGLAHRFLSGLPRVLTPRGRGLLYLDLPLVDGRSEPKLEELQPLAAPLHLQFVASAHHEPRSAKELVESSLDKLTVRSAASREGERRRLLAAYAAQRITAVQRGVVVAS